MTFNEDVRTWLKTDCNPYTDIMACGGQRARICLSVHEEHGRGGGIPYVQAVFDELKLTVEWNAKEDHIEGSGTNKVAAKVRGVQGHLQGEDGFESDEQSSGWR